MSNLFSRHLHLCFFKHKYPRIPLSPPLPHPHSNQQQHHHHQNTQSPSSSSTTIHITHNYDADSSAHSTSKSTDEFFSSSSDSDSWEFPPPPDFATVFSTQRFFFSSPGRSNSIIESPDTRPSNSRNNNNKALIPKGGVRVPKYSVDPYVDFRRSMQEMIDARELVDLRTDWDYLHELLLCYLALNPALTHKYIVRAFTDLVVDLLSSSSSSHSPPPSSVVKTSHRQKSKIPGRVVSQGGCYNW